MTTGVATRTQSDLPVLHFGGQRRSGPSRRKESLVAWVKVSQKARLRVVEVDGDRQLDVVRRFGIREFPSLVLIVGRRVVARLEGRSTGQEIDQLLRTHLPA
jgi:thioredoxin-like negative regulator of GroEL